MLLKIQKSTINCVLTDLEISSENCIAANLEIDSENCVAVDPKISSDGGFAWTFIFFRVFTDQNRDKNTSKPTPNTPTSFNGEYKCKEREKVTLPLLKVVCNNCMSNYMFLFSSSSSKPALTVAADPPLTKEKES